MEKLPNSVFIIVQAHLSEFDYWKLFSVSGSDEWKLIKRETNYVRLNNNSSFQFILYESLEIMCYQPLSVNQNSCHYVSC
jgi:hypothetical protein